MNDPISLSQAFRDWSEEVRPAIPADDHPALAESWNDYTDALCKQGLLTALQYHYAPSFDDPMPGEGGPYDPLEDDRRFILCEMGLEMECTPVSSRPGATSWPDGAQHWHIALVRGDASTVLYFTTNKALDGAPDVQDVMHAWLCDVYVGELDFADFLDECGFTFPAGDREKAKAIYKESSANAQKAHNLFLDDEIEQLNQLFENY